MDIWAIDIKALNTKRINITASVNTLEDLFRYLKSNYGKPTFLYIQRAPWNTEIFEKIGRCAAINRTDWKFWMEMGIISTMGKIMTLAIGVKKNKRDLKLRGLVLEEYEV